MTENVLIFVIGLMVGSFLNVCIWRMPRDISVRKPNRSFCPHCKKTIPWYDNIPLISFIALKARCRFCKGAISWRYPIVELLTGLLFLAVFRHFGASFTSPVYMLFVGGLIVATFVDIDFQIIPDEISLGGIVIGFFIGVFGFVPATHLKSLPLIFVFLVGALISIGLFCLGRIVISYLTMRSNQQQDYDEVLDMGSIKRELLFSMTAAIVGSGILYFFVAFWQYEFPPYVIGLFNAIVGASVGAGIVYITGLLGTLAFKKDAMGGGDVKLLAMMGAFLGWQAALIIFFLAPFLGTFLCMAVNIRKIALELRKKEGVFAQGAAAKKLAVMFEMLFTGTIPYGPFLSAAALVALFYQERIIGFVLAKVIY